MWRKHWPRLCKQWTDQTRKWRHTKPVSAVAWRSLNSLTRWAVRLLIEMWTFPTSAWTVKRDAQSSWKGNAGTDKSTPAKTSCSDKASIILTEDTGDRWQQHFNRLSVAGLDRQQQDRNVFSRPFECLAVPESKPQYSQTKIVISQANFWQQGSSAPHEWYSSQRWRSLWTRSTASSTTYTHVKRIHRMDKSMHIMTGLSFLLQTMLTQRLQLVPNAWLFFIQTIGEHQVNAD